MAGDWIKMRSELLTHPRFLRLARELIFGDDHGFLAYVCGEDALGIGVASPRNESVTERALRCVTERALHDTALCALVRIWCAVNAHCKVDGDDAVCLKMDLIDLDTLAGFSGFGAAMSEAGWVKEDQEDNCLRFPNFCEYNEPACLRKSAKSGRERAAEYRARKKAAAQSQQAPETGSKKRVTNVTKSNGREEKRREEYKDKEEEEGARPESTSADQDLLSMFFADWNATPGVHPCGSQHECPSSQDLLDRLADPNWCRLYPQALARFPLRYFTASGHPMKIATFLREGTVQRVLQGHYDHDPNEPRGKSAKKLPADLYDFPEPRNAKK